MGQRLPYTGKFTVTLDAKHRVILPAALRKLAEMEDPTGDFYLTSYTRGCLRLYTSAGYMDRLEMMRNNRDAIDDDEEYAFAERVYERFLHNSLPLRLGEQGRLVIPSELVEAANLKPEGTDNSVHIIGRDEVIEIWEPQAYAREFAVLSDDQQRTDEMQRKLNRRRPNKRGNPEA